MADLVIVNSSFTEQSLVRVGIEKHQIRVIPLGAPTVRDPETDAKSSLIFLSAGTQSVRKGVHYLLDAWRRLAPAGDVELWLIGAMTLPPILLEGLPGRVIIRPSVPREELFEIYRRSSVLVFPSLAEGFGMVITEAMANGLPVITTPNTAGPDLIEHGRNGFLVPIRDVDALAGAMQRCIDDRAGLATMGREAVRSAARWQWSDYRAMLASEVRHLLDEPDR